MNLLTVLQRALRPADPDSTDPRDPALIEALLGPTRRAGRWWYRQVVEGQEHLPAGPALIVGNHNAGAGFLEAFAALAQVVRPEERWVGLTHDHIIQLPLVGRVLSHLGAVRASPGPAERALAEGAKVVVFPGGNREAFRPFSQRDQVDLAGHLGFVRLAVRAGVPIVPLAMEGGHRSLLILRRGERLARRIGSDRWLRSPSWPLMVALPWGLVLGPAPHLPLPVQAQARFLPPIYPGLTPEKARDDQACRRVYAEVEASLQQAVTDLARARRARRAARWRSLVGGSPAAAPR